MNGSPAPSRGASGIFEAALEVLPEPILIHDAERILFVNAAARRVLRAERPEDLVGRPIQTIVHPDGYSAGVQRRRILNETGKPLGDTPLKLVALDGTTLYARAVGIPLRTSAGMAILVAATFITG